MNPNVLRFYQSITDIEGIKDPFQEVVILDERFKLSDETLEMEAPTLPRPWLELSRLDVLDRIEFIRLFWENTLPFQAKFDSFLDYFFSQIEDVAVILTRSFPKAKYNVEMIYSFKDQKSFFRGKPPISQENLNSLNAHFDYLLPRDFLAFLQIHDGFTKGADEGVLSSNEIKIRTKQIREFSSHSAKHITQGTFDPNSLIVFYQSFAEDFFHCFYTEWFPQNEVGNVFYSMNENRISQISEGPKDLAFYSFLDWLVFYMEEIEYKV